MRQEITHEAVKRFVERLCEQLPHEECRSCDCLQGLPKIVSSMKVCSLPLLIMAARFIPKDTLSSCKRMFNPLVFANKHRIYNPVRHMSGRLIRVLHGTV